MVEVKKADKIKSPLILFGFSFFIVFINESKFSLIWSSEKSFLPIETPTLPSLSFFISIRPDFNAFTGSFLVINWQNTSKCPKKV